MSEEENKNLVNEEKSESVDNSSFDDIIVSKDLEENSNSPVSSVVSYTSDLNERKKIVFYSLFIAFSFVVLIYSVHGFERLEVNSPVKSKPNTSVFDNKVAEIIKANSIVPEENELSIKYVLDDKEHLLNLLVSHETEALGDYNYITYDADIYLDGLKLRNSSYSFDGTLANYHGELLSKELSTEEQIKSDRDTYIYLEHKIVNSVGDELYVLFIKSPYDDVTAGFLFVINEENALVYFAKLNGPYYNGYISNETIYGINGFHSIDNNAIKYIEKKGNTYIEKSITFEDNTPVIKDGSKVNLVRK